VLCAGPDTARQQRKRSLVQQLRAPARQVAQPEITAARDYDRAGEQLARASSKLQLGAILGDAEPD